MKIQSSVANFSERKNYRTNVQKLSFLTKITKVAVFIHSVATLSIQNNTVSKLEARNLKDVDDNIRGGQPAQS